MWQNLSSLLLKMNVPVFETLLLQEITYNDDFVKKNAIIKDVQIDDNSVIREKTDFVQRRKRVLDTQIVYEEEDKHHPMIMI